MKSVSSCLCAVQNFSPCIHGLRSMLKKVHLWHVKHLCLDIISVAATFYQSQNKPQKIVDEINPYLVRPNSGNYHCKTKYSRHFVHNVSAFFSLTASVATGTQDLSISRNVQNGVQIAFHLRSKIHSKGFGKPFKLLQTENALVHKPFVQNADSAVIFINPCPEICILKAGKFPLIEPWQHQVGISNGNSLRCFFFSGYGATAKATEGPSGVQRKATATRTRLRQFPSAWLAVFVFRWKG